MQEFRIAAKPALIVNAKKYESLNNDVADELKEERFAPRHLEKTWSGKDQEMGLRAVTKLLNFRSIDATPI